MVVTFGFTGFYLAQINPDGQCQRQSVSGSLLFEFCAHSLNMSKEDIYNKGLLLLHVRHPYMPVYTRLQVFMVYQVVKGENWSSTCFQKWQHRLLHKLVLPFLK